MKQVRVLFFGRLADLVCSAESLLSIDEGISSRELYLQLLSENGALPSLEQDSGIKVAVNQTLADWDSRIQDGDEVAFLPLVTGG